MTAFYRWEGDVLHLFVRVQPKASSDAFAEVQEARIKVRITAPPIDGKANEHLVKFIAKACGVAKSQVKIKNGETGRNKHICVTTPKQLPAGVVREKIG